MIFQVGEPFQMNVCRSFLERNLRRLVWHNKQKLFYAVPIAQLTQPTTSAKQKNYTNVFLYKISTCKYIYVFISNYTWLRCIVQRS